MDVFEDAFFVSIVSEFLSSERYKEMTRFIAHGDWSVYDHSLHVASLCYEMGKKKGLSLDYRSLIRAAMLHDYYGYDWHKPHPRLHGFRHPYRALRNAEKDFSVSPLEAKLIKGHMFPLTFWHLPFLKEMRLLSRCDRLSAMYEHRYRKEENGRRSLFEYAFGK